MMAVRYADCTRRWHRNREASETRCAQTADASLSVSVPGGACSQRAALTAVVGAAFLPHFLAEQKAGRPPGRIPGYSPRQ